MRGESRVRGAGGGWARKVRGDGTVAERGGREGEKEGGKGQRG